MPKLEMDTPRTTNPAGNTVYQIFPEQVAAPAVIKRQEPKHTHASYLSDLDKATRRKATSSPRRVSSKT
jgi:hypothetical protein